MGNFGWDRDKDVMSRAKVILEKAKIDMGTIETLSPAYSNGSGSSVDMLFQRGGCTYRGQAEGEDAGDHLQDGCKTPSLFRCAQDER
jgi:hypothetical protein